MLNQSSFVKWEPYEGEDFNPHPNPVCEPVNLACTSLPDLSYKLKSSSSIALSTLQVETIRRIFQSFKIRCGFLLGDSTGVGKGRTIAGVLYENKARDPNFRAIWVSANGRLKIDAEKEISQICNIEELKNNLMFTSYTAILNKIKLDNITNFLNNIENKENECEKLIILDECHCLRNNSVSSKVIYDLIEKIPNINVLYSSATAASSSKHLQYLNKLELWGEKTPFPTYEALSSALKSHGAPLMELLSIQMRSSGSYVSRQLSFENVIMEHKHIELNKKEIKMYDECTHIMTQNGIIGGSSHQTFFQKLITGIKTKYAIQIAKERLKIGDSVVISLINTGEAYAKRSLKTKDKTSHFKVCEDKLDEFGIEVENMPINPIDEIIDAFGYENVAELTGRKTTYKKNSKGIFEYYSKDSLENEAEKFQKGEKNIAILSRAGGIGISLQDITGKRRTHIILEMPWSAEDFMQQIGRTHRSNSLTSPYYILLSTNIPSEMRFASAIVNKLSSMGALVRGDRSCSDVKWLDIPKWSVNTRRSLGLFLATSELYYNNKNIQIQNITRNHALAICGFDPRTDISDIILKTKLTNMIVEAIESEEASINEKQNYINAVKSLYPQDVSCIFNSWSHETHIYYPDPFKDRVFTLLLCQNAWETRSTLGILPEALIYYIIELMSYPATLEETNHASKSFTNHKIKLNDLSKTQTESVLNKLLGMEINVQKTIVNYTSFLAYPKKNIQVCCFMKFIKEKTGSSIDCSISDIRIASFSEGSTGIQVIMSYSPVQIENPPSNAQIWRNPKNNKIVWLKGNELISTDGNKFHVEEASNNFIANKGYIQVTYRYWEYGVRKNHILSKKKARKLPKSYFLATENAMNSWERSLHRVLRIPPSIQFPKGLIGLLVFFTS
tara:strand:- start:300 stop:3002 length:2703 start_codon:yes stop_codon:yes gene_type:complete